MVTHRWWITETCVLLLRCRAVAASAHAANTSCSYTCTCTFSIEMEMEISFLLLQISDSITSIGRGAFQGCSSLAAVHIPESRPPPPASLPPNGAPCSPRCTCRSTSGSDGAFPGCSSLATMHIPDSVILIGEEARMAGCSLLARHGACGVTAPVDYRNVHHAAAAAVVAAAAAAS